MDDFYIDEHMNACYNRICESLRLASYSVRFREKQMENAERDRMLANDPDHEEGEMYSGSDGDYDGGRRGVEYRSRRGTGKEFVDARELIRESRRARSRSADTFGKTFHAFIRFDLFDLIV